jgi:hypothetical protein
LNIDNKALTVYGEAMMSKLPPDQSDYVIYENSFQRFDPPHKEHAIVSSLKEKILNFIIIE